MPLPIFFAKTQARQHRAHFGFDRISVASAKFVLHSLVPVGHSRIFGAGVVDLRHLVQSAISISCSMARRSSNTDMHSAKTVRPERVRPSCGRYPAEVPLATIR